MVVPDSSVLWRKSPKTVARPSPGGVNGAMRLAIFGAPMSRVYLTIQRYGNMSAATVPVALCEALEQGRIKPGSLLLMPAFGGGLTFCAPLLRWGSRIQPLGESNVELPPATESALTIVNRYRALKPPLQPGASD